VRTDHGEPEKHDPPLYAPCSVGAGLAVIVAVLALGPDVWWALCAFGAGGLIVGGITHREDHEDG
jgi:hypothetical protein